METVKASIAALIRTVLTDLTPQQNAAIVSHLTSVDIGVTKYSKLKAVTEAMLPSNVHLPMVDRALLIEAFKAVPAGDGENIPLEAGEQAVATAGPSTSTAGQNVQPGQPPAMDIRQRRAQELEYSFLVPWSEVPKQIRTQMRQYSEQFPTTKRCAPNSLMTSLRQAITKLLQKSWESFRNNHPAITQKSPGRALYKSIANQVAIKYGECTDIQINGQTVGKGANTFVNKLEEAIENAVKKLWPSDKPRKALKCTGTVGVLLEQYNPGVPTQQKAHQEGQQEYLQNIHKMGKEHYDWPSILESMNDTYLLQRDHIVEAVQIIQEKLLEQEAQEKAEAKRKKQTGHLLGGEEEHQEEETEDDVEAAVEERQMEKLKKLWPFLFTPKCLDQHALRLSSRDLPARYLRFKTDHMEYLLMFLVSGTKVNIKNLILQHKLERKRDAPEGSKCLLLMEMLANHFVEDINELIITCERTTDADLAELTVLEDKVDDGTICILALDHDMYAAKQFLICADKTVIMTVESAVEALIGVMNACFVFDLHYPRKLPKLFEFIERFIFQMALVDSKVLKNGKQIAVVTEAVRGTCDRYEQFKAIVARALEE